MKLDLPTLLRHAWRSVFDPREEVRWIKAIEMPRAARWEALLLIIVVSVILGQLSVFLIGGNIDGVLEQFMRNPFLAGGLQLLVLVAMVQGVFWIGRAMGGVGGFSDAILLIAWIQFVMACFHVIQTATMILLPSLAGIVTMLGMALFFWLLTNFVAELHGFRSLGMVFLTIIVSIIVSIFSFAFGIYVILALFGFDMSGISG